MGPFDFSRFIMFLYCRIPFYQYLYIYYIGNYKFVNLPKSEVCVNLLGVVFFGEKIFSGFG